MTELATTTPTVQIGPVPTVLAAVESGGTLQTQLEDGLGGEGRDGAVADAARPVAEVEAALDRPALRRVLRDQLAEVLRPLLDVPYVSPLLGAWSTWAQLREAGAATSSSDLPQDVNLAGGHVTLEKHPQLKVTLDDRVLATIEVGVTVDVTAVALAGVVRRGRLTALEGGPLRVEAKVSVGGETVASGSAELDPAVAVPLGDGIPLVQVPAQRPETGG